MQVTLRACVLVALPRAHRWVRRDQVEMSFVPPNRRQLIDEIGERDASPAGSRSGLLAVKWRMPLSQ